MSSTPHPVRPPEPQLPSEVGTGLKEASDKGNTDATIADLVKRVRLLENSEKGLWKRLVVIVGVIGGILALPGVILDIIARFRPSPDVHFTWQEPVVLTYDSQTKNLKLLYSLGVNNTNGTAGDRIKFVSIDLKVADQQSFPIGYPNYGFQYNQQDLGAFLTIGKGDYKSVDFYVTLKQGLADLALTDPGQRETDVNFTLESRFRSDRAYPIITNRFCLHNMDAEVLNRLRKDGGTWAADKTSCK